MAAIFPHWCGSTAGVTTSVDTGGTEMLLEERSYRDSVTFWYNIHKKKTKTGQQILLHEANAGPQCFSTSLGGYKRRTELDK